MTQYDIHERVRHEKLPASNADQIREVMKTWKKFLALTIENPEFSEDKLTAEMDEGEFVPAYFLGDGSAVLMARAAGDFCMECEDCLEMFGEDEDG